MPFQAMWYMQYVASHASPTPFRTVLMIRTFHIKTYCFGTTLAWRSRSEAGRE